MSIKPRTERAGRRCRLDARNRDRLFRKILTIALELEDARDEKRKRQEREHQHQSGARANFDFTDTPLLHLFTFARREISFAPTRRGPD